METMEVKFPLHTAEIEKGAFQQRADIMFLRADGLV